MTVISYNSRGFHKHNKQDFIKSYSELRGCATTVCDQQNFLLKNTEYFAHLPKNHEYSKLAFKGGVNGGRTNKMFVDVPVCLNEKKRGFSTF